MSRHIEHEILAPDGRSLAVIAAGEVRRGETIQRFIDRQGWYFHLPTRCFLNGEVIPPAKLKTYRIRIKDEIRIVSRPGRGGGGSGASTAKSIGMIVAMVSLAIIAPWAGGIMASTLGLAGATLLGTSYATIFASVILGAGSLLISQFMKPKTAKQEASTADVFSITAAGNTARPLQMIPVQYGDFRRAPDYSSPSFSIYRNNIEYLYQVFCIGCGRYAHKETLIDDTLIWTAENGLDPSFSNFKWEWVEPGDPLTLFDANIVTASEVGGQKLPSPSRDANQGWVGPFTVNPPNTEARKFLLDISFPNGLGASFKGNEIAVPVQLQLQCRRVDAVGAPVGDFIELPGQGFYFLLNAQWRTTIEIPNPQGGRWQLRMRRLNDSHAENPLVTGGHDDVLWLAARAVIDGVDSVPGVTRVAMIAAADASLSGFSRGRISFRAKRILEVFDSATATWVERETDNPVDAAIDMWRNADYSAGLADENLFLQDLIYQRDAAAARGDTFDHVFTDAVSIQDAQETALRVIVSNAAYIGDAMTIVRDEPRPVRQLFTDNQIVRGTLSVKRRLLDETWADGVVVNYVDRTTWRAAEAASHPNLVRPARVEIPGITRRAQAIFVARRLAAVNRYRRREATFQVELEGRLLKRGDLVLVQSEFPRSWGTGGEVRAYSAVGGPVTITLDRPMTFQSSGPHFLQLRRRNGKPWGPVRVTQGSSPAIVVVDQADRTTVETQQGLLLDALFREPNEEPPSFVFSAGEVRIYRGLVDSGSMRDSLATIKTTIEAPEVYTVTSDDIPPIPQPPQAYDRSASLLVDFISGRALQRGAALYLAVGWGQVQAAASYLCRISLDEKASWNEIYRGSSTQAEAPIPSMAKVWIQVACISASGLIADFTEMSSPVQAPAISISSDGFELLDVGISALDQELRDVLIGSGPGSIGEARQRADGVLQDLTRALSADPADRTAANLPVRALRDDLDSALEVIADLQGKILDTQGKLVEMGAEMGPDGVYRIAGIARTDGRISNVSITLDALAGKVALLASTVVDENFDEIIDRVAQIAVTLDALNAALTLKVDTASFDPAVTRIGQLETDFDGIEQALTLKASQQVVSDLAAVLSNAVVQLQAQGTLLASVTSSSVALDNDMRDATIEQILSRLAEMDGGFNERLANAAITLSARADENGRSIAETARTLLAVAGASDARYSELFRAIADGDQASIEAITAYAAQITDPVTGLPATRAALTAFQELQATKNTALTTSVTDLTSRVGNAETAVSDVAQARVDGDEALGLQVDAVRVKTDAVSAEGRRSTLVSTGPDGTTVILEDRVSRTIGGSTVSGGRYTLIKQDGTVQIVEDADNFYVGKLVDGQLVFTKMMSYDAATGFLTIPNLRVTGATIAKFNPAKTFNIPPTLIALGSTGGFETDHNVPGGVWSLTFEEDVLVDLDIRAGTSSNTYVRLSTDIMLDGAALPNTSIFLGGASTGDSPLNVLRTRFEAQKNKTYNVRLLAKYSSTSAFGQASLRIGLMSYTIGYLNPS